MYLLLVYQYAIYNCMTNSERLQRLHKGVYERFKELVPVTVKPDMILADYETALLEELGIIFQLHKYGDAGSTTHSQAIVDIHLLRASSQWS